MLKLKQLVAFLATSALAVCLYVPSAFAADLSAADALVLNKTANKNGDGTYTLTLESYTTAVVEGVPTDVVLLLDRSGSMYDAAEIGDTKKNGVYMTNTLTYAQLDALSAAEKNNGPQQPGYYMMAYDSNLYCIEWTGSKWVKYDIPANTYSKGTVKTHRTDTTSASLSNKEKSGGVFYKSIFGVSYDGVKTFLDEISEASNTRVAIASFGGYIEKDWKGTGVYNGSEECNYATYGYNSNEFLSAFKSVENAGELQQLYDSLSIYEPAINQTATGAGFRLAENLFAKCSSSSRNHIVIVFTDGEPTGTPNGTGVTEGMSATQHAKQRVDVLKGSSYNAKVYAIGPQGGNATPSTLKYFASDPDSSYFFNPSATETAAAFKEIAGYIVEGTKELNKDTLVVDGISPYFTLPEGTVVSDIEVYTADYEGVSGGKASFASPVKFTSAKVEVDDEAGIVRVSNFDYNANAVYMTGSTPHGKKLIVEIPVETKLGFLGGDGVPTNTSEAGIYNGDSAVAKFEVPEVNVDVREVSPSSSSSSIYLSQTASLPTIANIGHYAMDGEDFVVDGIRNAYADVVYTIEDPDGNVMTYTIPAGTAYESLTDNGWDVPEGLSQAPLLKADTTYKITCTVTSSTNPSNTITPENPSTADVYVYKPEITFNDSEIALGIRADYSANGGVDSDDPNEDDVRWLHGEEEADESVMGVAPTLEYGYSPVAEFFEEDTDVKVTVTAKGNGTNVPEDQGITQYATFYRDACEFEGCTHEGKALVSVTDESRVNFVVHVSTFDLTIAKSGVEQPLDDDSKRTIAEDDAEYQSTVFTITCAEDEDFSMKVAVHGNSSVTIKGLRVGTYTVTEDTGWSWRYTPEVGAVTVGSTGSEAAVKIIGGNATASFDNDREEGSKWLSGDNWCANLFGSRGITKITGANVASGSGN